MGSALALGTFDGLHKGHMAVINSALLSEHTPKAVVFSDPPAAVLFNKKNTNLLDPKDKLELLKNLGFKEVVALDFCEVKDITASKFLDLLKQKFNPKKICCGFNYTFGKDKGGDVKLLEQFCKEQNIQLAVTDNVMCGSVSISSSYIRSLIQNGDVKKANTFLYIPFSFSAAVFHGDERGRTIGFPTINQMYPTNIVLPRFGVYASHCKVDGKEYNSITNIGVRPTYKTEDITAETYILNFNGNLYGKTVTVTLKNFLRDETVFKNITELKEQITSDINTAFGG